MNGGGKAMAATGGPATFAFTAKRTAAGNVSGHFNWVNHDTKCKIDGEVLVMTACPSDRSATFEGSCGTGCSFVVRVRDAGEPGTRDTISVSTTGACQGTAGEGRILNGNIQYK